MICSKRRPVNWVRGAAVALVGYCVVVFVPSVSLAQYPGSAGNLSGSAHGASSSAGFGSGDGSASSSASSSSNSSDGLSTDSSTSDFMTDSGSYDGGNGPDGHEGYGTTTVAVLPTKRALRKRALIRQFRLEFAKTLIIETATKRPLNALHANLYLDKFSKEIDTGLDHQANVKSLSRDLGLMRDALNDRIDKVIASYGGDAPLRGFFSKTGSGGETASALRIEVQKLKFKHELLAFGEYSLQAMGYYAK